MKGVVLAGGTGSRLLPLTKVTNKHLLPVGRKPMIYYPVEKLIEAGIKDILIVTGVEHMGDMVQTLGSGKDFGCEFTYRVQDKAGGIAEALGLARGFVHESASRQKCCVILGDNLFEDSIADVVREFDAGHLASAHLFLKEVPDPDRFGVAEIAEDRKYGGQVIVSIEEKPAKPKSNLAVTGVYLYNFDIFEIITSLKPSARGELEISDANREYMRREILSHTILKGWWSDAGTHESLARAVAMVNVGIS